jgi:hypothetical protein
VATVYLVIAHIQPIALQVYRATHSRPPAGKYGYHLTCVLSVCPTQHQGSSSPLADLRELDAKSVTNSVQAVQKPR